MKKCVQCQSFIWTFKLKCLQPFYSLNYLLYNDKYQSSEANHHGMFPTGPKQHLRCSHGE